MRRFWMAAALVVIPLGASAQGSDQTVFAPAASVLNLMTPEQFAAAGLGKLTPAELRALSEWVRMHSLQVGELARTAALNPEPGPSGNPSMMETRMADDFTGWDGGTVFEFANGQVWRQTSLPVALTSTSTQCTGAAA